MTEAAGIRKGKGSRQRKAAIWLWSEITGSPLRLAPAYAPVRLPAEISGSDLEATDGAWDYLGRFYRTDLPLLRPALTSYARQLTGPDEPLRPFTQEDLVGRLDAAGPRLFAGPAAALDRGLAHALRFSAAEPVTGLLPKASRSPLPAGDVRYPPTTWFGVRRGRRSSDS